MKSTDIHVTHIMADGAIVEDISKVTIPAGHPIYAFLANVIKERLQLEQTEKGA